MCLTIQIVGYYRGSQISGTLVFNVLDHWACKASTFEVLAELLGLLTGAGRLNSNSFISYYLSYHKSMIDIKGLASKTMVSNIYDIKGTVPMIS